MAFELFIASVALLAIVYATGVRFIQNKLVDRSEMEAFQAESRRLNEDFEKARKSGNQKKMDEIMQKQMEQMSKSSTLMFNSLKPMSVILVIFFACTWAIAHFDPSTQDDITMNMTDDGRGCDHIAGDGIWTACYNLSGNYGKWTATVKGFEGSSEFGTNQTFFTYKAGSDNDTYVETGKGEGIAVTTDKQVYSPGETAIIKAVPANMTKEGNFLFIIPIASRQTHVDNVQLTLSNGTYFRVDLPFTVPFTNVKSIYQPYWWFFSISIVSNIILSLLMGRLKK